jgi:hypothetical protein
MTYRDNLLLAQKQNPYWIKPELLDPEAWEKGEDSNWRLRPEDFQDIDLYPRIGKAVSFCEAFRMHLVALADLPLEELIRESVSSLPTWCAKNGFYIELGANEIAAIRRPSKKAD